MLHLVLPCLSVRQQVANPSRPQVDLAAHVITSSLQAARNEPPRTAASTAWRTQLM
jgi:hypothetical protein